MENNMVARRARGPKSGSRNARWSHHATGLCWLVSRYCRDSHVRQLEVYFNKY